MKTLLKVILFSWFIFAQGFGMILARDLLPAGEGYDVVSLMIGGTVLVGQILTFLILMFFRNE